MENLEQSLRQHHLIVLRMLGEWWEMELIGKDKDECAALLAEQLQQTDLQMELLYLQPEEAAALKTLAANGGRMTVGEFGRNYGTIREMGPAKLEREEPWYSPINVAEALWYRAFLFRAFDETDDGLIEFYYLPQELLAQFETIAHTGTKSVLKEAIEPFHDEPNKRDDLTFLAAAEATVLLEVDAPAIFTPANTTAVDDLTTLLAFAQRNQLNGKENEWLSDYLVDANRSRRSLLLTLVWELGMLKRGEEEIRPTRTAVNWLKADRETQLATLIDKWTESDWNPLRHLPTVRLEGDAPNDPTAARNVLISILPRDEQWFSINTLIALVKQNAPDFQRPTGDYNTWYVRDGTTDEYLRGFASWEKVEGALLRFVLTTVMAWLGLVDCSGENARLTPRAVAWLDGRVPNVPDSQMIPIIQPDATIIVPRQTNRFTRFQTARIAEQQPYSQDKPYFYRITPQSLKFARDKQGIAPQRVLTFLRSSADGQPLPKGIQRAIERYSERGTEGTLSQIGVLRVGDEHVIETLQKNSKTRELLGERLGELAIVVHDMEKLRHVTAQLGLLLELS